MHLTTTLFTVVLGHIVQKDFICKEHIQILNA